MATSPRCAETTHRSKAPLCLKVLHIVYVQSQEYGILTSTIEETQSLQYFLDHQSIYAPLSHVRLFLSLSILTFESVKVGDHFDVHFGYVLTMH